jgi:hypothetical protein
MPNSLSRCPRYYERNDIMFKVMAVIQTKLGKSYFPITEQEKKADAERDIVTLKELNPGYKFAIMDED